MKTKHTPGEWWEDDLIVFANGIRIADCHPNDEDEIKRTRSQVEADARLIAAAPELLDALKALRKWLVEATERELDHQTLDDALVWAKNITQSAITKATTRKDK